MATVYLAVNDGTTYRSSSLDTTLDAGTLSVIVKDATSRNDAISAAKTAYPHHPDNSSLTTIISWTAHFVGFSGCSTQNWRVELRYGLDQSEALGNIGVSGYSVSGQTQHDSADASFRLRNQSSACGAASSIISAYSTPPCWIGSTNATPPPLTGFHASVSKNTTTGLEVVVGTTYRRTPFDLQAYVASLNSPTNGTFATMRTHYIPCTTTLSQGDFRAFLSGTTPPFYQYGVKGPNGQYNRSPVKTTLWLPGVQISILTRSDSGPSGTILGTASISANGQSFNNAILQGIDTIPVMVDSGGGLTVQYQSTYIYTWGKLYQETVDAWDNTNNRWQIHPTLVNP